MIWGSSANECFGVETEVESISDANLLDAPGHDETPTLNTKSSSTLKAVGVLAIPLRS